MSEQPILRLIARHGTGSSMEMIAAVLHCGCVVASDMHAGRIDGERRSAAGTLPCPIGHRRRTEPAEVARCPECRAELGGEVRDCDSECGNFGWTGEPACTHLADRLNQLRLHHGSHPWRPTAGWYCMGCSFPPR